MFSAKDGGGMVGIEVLIPLPIPTLRRRLANMILKVRAYLPDFNIFLGQISVCILTSRPQRPTEAEPIAQLGQ